MKPVLIVYATRTGHTQRIASHLADALRTRGYGADMFDACHAPEPSLKNYGAVILAASVLYGRHQRELIRFARRHRVELTRMPGMLLSVSLSQATAEDAAAPEPVRRAARRQTQRAIDQLLDATGVRPDVIAPVAGALLYTRYRPLKRWLMQTMSRLTGRATDTSQDHVYTNWAGVDQLVTSFTGMFSEPKWAERTGDRMAMRA